MPTSKPSCGKITPAAFAYRPGPLASMVHASDFLFCKRKKFKRDEIIHLGKNRLGLNDLDLVRNRIGAATVGASRVEWKHNLDLES